MTIGRAALHSQVRPGSPDNHSTAKEPCPMDHALWHEKVDNTFTVQDCVLEFLFKTYHAVLFDETPESAETLDDRLHWKEQVDRRFANTTYEVTFVFQNKHFRATKSENHYCAIWKERHPRKRRTPCNNALMS